jgi:hypothetical protein
MAQKKAFGGMIAKIREKLRGRAEPEPETDDGEEDTHLFIDESEHVGDEPPLNPEEMRRNRVRSIMSRRYRGSDNE